MKNAISSWIRFALAHQRAVIAGALALCLIGSNVIAGDTVKQWPRPHGNGYTAAASASESAREQTSRTRANESYGKLPLSFEENRGQFNPEVKFLARAGGCNVFLTSCGAAFNLASNPADGPNKSQASTLPGKSRDLAEFQIEAAERSVRPTVTMRFAGASTRVRLSGLERLPGRTNYIKGNDPAKWRKDIPSFARIKYESLYLGIDLVYYSNNGRLEYDLKVAPGADPAVVAIEVAGADNLIIDERGALVAHTAAGDLRQELPAIYQEIQGARHLIAGHYVMKGSGRVGFQVGDYDNSRALTIDPSIVYTKTFGGSGNDGAYGVAVDTQGNAYVTGVTASPDFPITNPLKANLGGAQDAFVTKLDPTGTPIYSTYLGGSGLDQGNSIAVDASGNAYVTGVTGSSDFPLAGALQSTYGGNGDAFVSKLNAAGNGLAYSTYLGGSGLDQGLGIAVDASGNAYIGGSTFSSNFPVQNAFQAAKATAFAENDAFITRLNASGSALTYSSYLGGPGLESANGIALGAAGTAYITGSTTSGGGAGGFPTTPGVLQSSSGGSSDVFVAKFNTNATGALSLGYSTFLGGNATDVGNGVAVDLAGNAYVTGSTASPNFPRTANAAQSSLNGPSDAFIVVLNPTASSLIYGTYYGGNGDDSGQAIALAPQSQSGASIVPAADTAVQIIITGIGSPGLQLVDPVGNPLPSGIGAFLIELKTPDFTIAFSSFAGPSDATKIQGYGVSFIPGPGGSLILAGFSEFPGSANADGFVTLIKGPPQFDKCFLDESKRLLVRVGSITGQYSVEDCATGLLRAVGVGKAEQLDIGTYITHTTSDGEYVAISINTQGGGHVVVHKNVPSTTVLNTSDIDAEGPVSMNLADCKCPKTSGLSGPMSGVLDPLGSAMFPFLAPPPNSLDNGRIGSNINPSDAALTLSATVTPAEPSISLSFSPPTISPGQTVTLTVKTMNTPANTYTVRVVAKNDLSVAAATLTIKVNGPAFALGFENPLVIGQAGSSQTVQVNIVRNSGFTGNVTVSPPDLSALRIKVKPGSVATTDTSANFRFKIKGSAAPGIYLLTFTGQDDSGKLAGGTFILVIE